MEKIKVAVIGVGSISEQHINGYKNNENVELYAFCDINEKILKEKGDRMISIAILGFGKGRKARNNKTLYR